MLSIIICDDSKNEIDLILTILEDFSYNKEKLSIQTFNSPINLVKSIEAGNISDIYLLDIVMPCLSGIDIASIIRQKKDDVPIIFFTNSTEYALNAYELSALQYLVKPVQKNALFDALYKAIELIERKNKNFMLDTPNGIIPIKHKEIIFVEYNNHVMYFQTTRKLIASKYIRVAFSSALERLLEDSCFRKTHSAFIINLRHIKKMNKRSFLMTKSYEVPISKSRLEDLTHLYMQYFLGEEINNV